MKGNDLPYVQMSFKCKVLDKNGNIHPKPENIEEFSFGGYVFIVDGKAVPFDWDANSWSFTGSDVTVNTGYGVFFNEFTLPDYYDEDLKEVGLTRKDLTPEFLSHCEEIDEFFCEGGDVLIESITLHDDKGNNYSVKADVIKKFNEETKKKYK